MTSSRTPAASAVVSINRILILLVFLCAGCRLLKPPLKIVEGKRRLYRVHVIKRQGETLMRVAVQTSGNGNNWKAILQANPGLDLRKVKVGDRIRIPVELMKPRAKPAVASAAAPVKKALPAAAAQPVKVEQQPQEVIEKPAVAKRAEEEIPLSGSHSNSSEHISVIRDPAAPSQNVGEQPPAPQPEVVEPEIAEPVAAAPQPVVAEKSAPAEPAKAIDAEQEALMRRYEAMMQIIDGEDGAGAKPHE